MELEDVVCKLVGPIHPQGDESVDGERFENLKVLAKLVDQLVFYIDHIARMKDEKPHSIRAAGKFADAFLTELGIRE